MFDPNEVEKLEKIFSPFSPKITRDVFKNNAVKNFLNKHAALDAFFDWLNGCYICNAYCRKERKIMQRYETK
jgi:hypothetical protein